MPYFEFPFEGQLRSNYDIIAPDSFTLLIFTSGSTPEIEKITAGYEILSIAIPKTSGTLKLYRGFNIAKTGYYLIRPDHHIALISYNLDPVPLNSYLQFFLYEKQV